MTGVGATPRRIGAAEHDRLLADVSHLPQITASALMHVVGQRVGEDGLALAGRGLRDTTRLAASPADIWRDVAATNHPAVGAALDDLISVLQAMRDDLQQRRRAPAGVRLRRTLEAGAGQRAARLALLLEHMATAQRTYLEMRDPALAPPGPGH